MRSFKRQLDKFVDKSHLPKLTPEEIINMDYPITMKKIKTIT